MWISLDGTSLNIVIYVYFLSSNVQAFLFILTLNIQKQFPESE